MSFFVKKRRFPLLRSTPPPVLVSFVSFLPLAALCLYLFLSEPLAAVLLSFSAVLFHELGHLCCFVLTRTPLPRLAPAGAGIRLVPSLPLLPGTEALICLGGPLFNFLAAFFSFRLVRSGFGTLLGSLHLLYGVFNLLPFADTDGERLLRLLLLGLFGNKGKTAAAILSRAALIFFFFLCLFLYYLTGYGLCGIFFTLFFLFSSQSSRGTFFEIS